MRVKPLRKDLLEFLIARNLLSKWQKMIALFEANLRHPSLHTEILEPHHRGVYSFRIDRKYRALFFITDSGVEIFQITNHYKR